MMYSGVEEKKMGSDYSQHRSRDLAEDTTPEPVPPPPPPPPPPPTPAPTPMETEAPTPWTQTEAGIADNHEVGFQSDWGPSYASSMVYDFTRHAIYLTGVNYKGIGNGKNRLTSSCFLGHIPLMHLHNWKTVTEPPGGDDTEQTDDEVLACTAIASPDDMIVDDPNHLWLVGMNERSSNDRVSEQKGFVTAYIRDRSHVDWDVLLQTYTPKDEKLGIQVELPRAAIVDPDKHILYIASIVSEDATITPKYYKAEDSLPYPNTVAGEGQLLKRGTAYKTFFHTYTYDPQYTKLVPKGAQMLYSDQDMYVGGMAITGQLEKFIAVVGTVNGIVAFPPGLQKPNSGPRDTNDNKDMDGYVSIMARDADRPSGLQIRLDSINHGDDWIYNVCSSPPDETHVNGGVYVVGSTTSSFDPNAIVDDGDDNGDASSSSSSKGTNAFITKLLISDDLKSLTTEWTREFRSVSSSLDTAGRSEAFACHVIPHNTDVIYVGGTVYDGATIAPVHGTENVKSHGGDDIFVAQIDAHDGTINWLRQVGSSGDETLARNNGLFADAEGDAVIYGDTTGPLYRSRDVDEMKSDVFVMKLDFESGRYAPTFEEASSFGAQHGSKFFALLLLLAIGGIVYYSCNNGLCQFGFFNMSTAYNKYRRQTLKKDDGESDDDDDGFRDEDDGEYGGGSAAESNRRSVKSTRAGFFRKAKPYRDNAPEPNPVRAATESKKVRSSDPEPSHPNGTLEMSMMSNSKPYKDDPHYRPGRMFV